MDMAKDSDLIKETDIDAIVRRNERLIEALRNFYKKINPDSTKDNIASDKVLSSNTVNPS